MGTRLLLPLLVTLTIALLATSVMLIPFAKVPEIAGLSLGGFNAGSRVPAIETATPTPAAATPTAASPVTPNLTALHNAQDGCALGAPDPLGVVFTGTNAAAAQPVPNEVALTFDDGPTPYSTPPILTVLEQTHTPATFFVEGQYITQWPYLVQREWNDGFAIGVHTWDHPLMTRQTPAQMQHQIGDTISALHAALGAQTCVWLWRPPYGDYNGAVVQMAQSYGLSTIMWDVDPQDWSRPGTEQIVARVLAQVHPGAIILMHAGPALREQTADALPAILAGLKARGLTPVTLPKLLADGHYPGVRVIGNLGRHAP